MKTLACLVILIIGCLASYSQGTDSIQRNFKTGPQPVRQVTKNDSGIKTTTNYKPEIFTSGFIDILNNGQLNASARFIRLYIGEPKKICIPLSFYSGVSSNSFQPSGTQKPNESLVNNFINPLGGLVNISTDGTLFFSKRSAYTRWGLLYHAGERVLTGIKTGTILQDPLAGKPLNFLNTFGTIGLYFQTGAWDRNNIKNMGVSWLAFRYIGCYTNPQNLKSLLPGIVTNGFYHGYSIAWGVDITGFVNIKMVYYKYVKAPELNYYQPIYQFSFNYSMKN